MIIFVWINSSFIQTQRNTHTHTSLQPCKKLVKWPNLTWILMKHITLYSSPNWGALCCRWLSAVSLLTRHHEQWALEKNKKKKKKHMQGLCRYQHTSGELVSWLLALVETLNRCLHRDKIKLLATASCKHSQLIVGVSLTLPVENENSADVPQNEGSFGKLLLGQRFRKLWFAVTVCTGKWGSWLIPPSWTTFVCLFMWPYLLINGRHIQYSPHIWLGGYSTASWFLARAWHRLAACICSRVWKKLSCVYVFLLLFFGHF